MERLAVKSDTVGVLVNDDGRSYFLESTLLKQSSAKQFGKVYTYFPTISIVIASVALHGGFIVSGCLERLISPTTPNIIEPGT